MEYVRGVVRIHWLDRTTGKTGVFVEPGPVENGSVILDEGDEEWTIYQWTEGNYGCDCNRSAFFGGVDGDVDDSADARECSIETNRYVIRKLDVSRVGPTGPWEPTGYSETGEELWTPTDRRES